VEWKKCAVVWRWRVAGEAFLGLILLRLCFCRRAVLANMLHVWRFSFSGQLCCRWCGGLGLRSIDSPWRIGVSSS
jgi:hypothetical protein